MVPTPVKQRRELYIMMYVIVFECGKGRGRILKMKRLLIPVCVLMTAVVFASGCSFISQDRSQRSGPETTKEEIEEVTSNYVTDYNLKVNEAKYDVYGIWTIRKRRDRDKGTYLEIYTNQKSEKITEYSFEVYDTDEEARAAYEEWYKASKHKDSYGENEEPNWFKGEMPYVSDATIQALFYVEGNVIIIAELSCYNEWNGKSYDYTYREKYVLDYASEMKDYINGMVILTK